MLKPHAGDWDELLQAFRSGTRPLLLDEDVANTIAAEQPVQAGAVVAEAERLVTGERTYFGYPTVYVDSPTDWNYDPVAGYRWPAVAGSRIDHRAARSDPKWIWELNRLQHLPILAQAWLLSGDPRFAEAAVKELDSWLDQNPVGIGIAWRGAFEAGIRAISVAVALQGLRHSPALTTPRYRAAVRMLDASARYCWHGRSRFSSANNHLIGELAGMVTVHLACPELAAPAELYGRALDDLVAEADRQILPDGAGAEQAIGYQMFTAELLALVVVMMRLSGDQVPSKLVGALDRSTRYLIALVGSDDPEPRYGDDDDGLALRLGPERKRSVREHLSIMGAVTGNKVATRFGAPSLTAAWIAARLGTGKPEAAAVVGPAEVDANLVAPNGGLVVLRAAGQRLTMDVGPLGYLSTAAHGHADALSVTLSVDGRELISDPGTGSYYRNPGWRKVHRSTRAHSTVCVDGADQSVMGGPFYWRRHAATRVNCVDLDRGIVDAEHDGYRRFDDPVVHRRWLIAPRDDATIAVVDLLDGRSVHHVAVSWSLHPDLEASPTVDGHLATRDGIPVLQLCYAATSPIETGELRADEDSGMGWWSDRLEARRQAWLVGPRCRTRLPVAVLSVLRTVDAGVIAQQEIVRDGAMLFVNWTEQGIRRGYVIDSTGGGVVLDTASAPETSK